MKIISHRGNLNGRIPEMENSPNYILSAVNCGYEVEVDVWSIEGKFKLGHDFPQHEVSASWLKNLPLWCHAKNADALVELLHERIHCFWHEQDSYTLTSRGVPWCYPDKFIRGGITVIYNSPLDGYIENFPRDTLGVCVDFPNQWKAI